VGVTAGAGVKVSSWIHHRDRIEASTDAESRSPGAGATVDTVPELPHPRPIALLSVPPSLVDPSIGSAPGRPEPNSAASMPQVGSKERSEPGPAWNQATAKKISNASVRAAVRGSPSEVAANRRKTESEFSQLTRR